MSPYTFAELVREHVGQWIIVSQGGVIRATHRTAWPVVSFEDADPEPLHEKLTEWEDRRKRQHRPGADQ